MKKIPTLYLRDMDKRPALVKREINPDCLWVWYSEGVPTRKWDGTSVLIRNGMMYKRRELRPGDVAPPDFESLGTDENTGKTVGWVPVGDGPDDRWHREAFGGHPQVGPEYDGTYELVGPKINDNKDQLQVHMLKKHGDQILEDVPQDFDGLKQWLEANLMEGIVWHHPDGRMAKIKRRDFGLKW